MTRLRLPAGLLSRLPEGLRQRVAGSGPTGWIATAALVVGLIALVVAVTCRCGSEPRIGASGNVGPTIATAPSGLPSGLPGGQAAGSPTGSPGGGAASTAPGPAPAGADSVSCPAATVTVSDAASLATALSQATPGTTIGMQDGVYADTFKATTAGTAEQPIFLCGGPGAVIDGGDVKGGYALHLDGASYWRVVGFTIRNAQKGLMADRVQRTVIQGLTVQQIGDEAIHLRNHSSDNVVQANTVSNTGLRRDDFGEGVYIGTAESNWCTVTGCQPDRSDRNIVRGNTIGNTTAEPVDIKEGTTGGVVSGNTFDGSGLTGKHADSWVDVKGNGWLITGNVGRNSREDGFQTHEVVDGWGTDNVFSANTAEVNGAGWGFHLAPVRGNKVSCDNKVVGAAKGLANVDCS
jgi:hypothetical protein